MEKKCITYSDYLTDTIYKIKITQYGVQVIYYVIVTGYRPGSII